MRYLILIILLACSPAHGFYGAHVAASGAKAVGGGEPCDSGTYDFQSGDNESFETGVDGTFCTANITVSDTDGVIDTSSADALNCGSYNLKITTDEDSSTLNKVSFDFGSQDSTFNLRYYFKITSLQTFESGTVVQFTEDAFGTIVLFGIRHATTTGTPTRYQMVKNDLNYCSEYFFLSVGVLYRIDIDINGSAMAMKVYNTETEAYIFTTNGDPDIEANCSNTTATGARYMHFNDNTSVGDPAYHYYDDVKIDLSRGGYIGGQTCN